MIILQKKKNEIQIYLESESGTCEKVSRSARVCNKMEICRSSANISPDPPNHHHWVLNMHLVPLDYIKFNFFFFLLSVSFLFHWLSTPDGQHQDLNKTVFVFFIALKISISIHTECLYSPNGQKHNWISFVSFWWHGGPYNDLLVSHHIACFLHVVLFASFQNWIL